MSLAEHIKNNELLGIRKVAVSAGDGYRPRLAIAGASWMARNNYSTTPNITPNGFVHWAQALSYYAFDVVSYGAVGGRVINTVADNFDTEILAYSPDMVIIGGDCAGNAINNGVSAADCYATLTGMLAKCAGKGIIATVTTLPPNDGLSAANDASGAKNTETHKYNDLVRALCRRDRRIILLPLDEIYCDLSNADGRMVAAFTASATSATWTHDGTHPYPRAAIKAAQHWLSALSGRFGFRTLALPVSNNHPYKGLQNPVNYGVSGTLSGGASGAFVGNNCTLSGPAGTVISEVARTDFAANGVWKRIVATAVASSVTYTFTGGGIPANMTPGVTPVWAVCELLLNSAPTNLRGFKLALSYTGGGGVTHIGFNTSSSGNFATMADAGPYIPVGAPMLLFVPVGILPASATNLSLALEASKSSAGAMSVDYSVGRAAPLTADAVPFNNQTVVVP